MVDGRAETRVPQLFMGVSMSEFKPSVVDEHQMFAIRVNDTWRLEVAESTAIFGHSVWCLSAFDGHTGRCLAVKPMASCSYIETIDLLVDQFLMHGVPAQISCNTNMLAKTIGGWLAAVGVESEVRECCSFAMPRPPCTIQNPVSRRVASLPVGYAKAAAWRAEYNRALNLH